MCVQDCTCKNQHVFGPTGFIFRIIDHYTPSHILPDPYKHNYGHCIDIQNVWENHTCLGRKNTKHKRVTVNLTLRQSINRSRPQNVKISYQIIDDINH